MVERGLEWKFGGQDIGGLIAVIRGTIIHTLKSWDTAPRCLKTVNQKTQRLLQICTL
jgi:hypothetical protein